MEIARSLFQACRRLEALGLAVESSQSGLTRQVTGRMERHWILRELLQRLGESRCYHHATRLVNFDLGRYPSLEVDSVYLEGGSCSVKGHKSLALPSVHEDHPTHNMRDLQATVVGQSNGAFLKKKRKKGIKGNKRAIKDKETIMRHF